MGGIVSEVKKVVTKVTGFVSKVCKTVKKAVKKVVKKVGGFIKKCYNKYIKPWAQPIIDCAKKYVPFVDLAVRGYKAVKNTIKTVKNAYKTAKNYFTGKPYKKYWNKTKQYGKKTFGNIGKFIGNSTVFGRVYNIGKNIYETGKRIYKKAKNTVNFVRNSYGYIKDRINGKDSSYHLNQLRKNWNKSYLSNFNYKKYVNENTFDRINNVYKRAKNYYNLFERYKDKIKSNILKFNNMKNKFPNLLGNLRNKVELKKEYINMAKQYKNYSFTITNEYVRNVPYITEEIYKCPICQNHHKRKVTRTYQEKYQKNEKIFDNTRYEKYNEYINKIKNCEKEFTSKINEIDSFKSSIIKKEEEIRNIISEFKNNILSYKYNLNSSEYEIVNLGKNLNCSDFISKFNNIINEFNSYKINYF